LSFLFQITVRRTRASKSLLMLLLLAVIYSVLGFTVTNSRKPTGSNVAERFPCEGSSCGCGSADQCWEDCCCNSDLEKLAWATASGVEPPAFFVAKINGLSPKDTASHRQVCCNEVVESCSVEPTSNTLRESPSDKANANHNVVLIWKAASCLGIKHLWSLLASTYVQATVTNIPSDPPLIGLLALCDEDEKTRFEAPEPPIP